MDFLAAIPRSTDIAPSRLPAYPDPPKCMVLFDYHKGRDRGGPREILEDYHVTLQTGGYQVYDIYKC